MPSSPHDALFKSTFGRPEVARSELEMILPAALRAQIDLASLEACSGSFVDDELRHLHSDLLFRAPARGGHDGEADALVYVLFEHQSSFDPIMPLRLLRYVMRVWERWLRDHPTASKVPLVVPVLLHHGPAGWRAEPELASMLDAPRPLLDAARPYVPHFRFLLDDLADLPADAVASRALHALARLAQLALWSSRSIGRLREAAPSMKAIIATLARDDATRALLTQLYVYLLRVAQPDVQVEDVRTMLLELAGPEGAEDVMNAAEELEHRGEVRGLRHAIATTLAVRAVPLSELGRARLAGCDDPATLTRWLERAVTAGSESDLF